MTKRDRFPENTSPESRPDRPAETTAELAASLARIRREALERVTAQLDGRLPLLAEPAPRFGDIRLSVGKAVRERAETTGVSPHLSGNLG